MASALRRPTPCIFCQLSSFRSSLSTRPRPQPIRPSFTSTPPSRRAASTKRAILPPRPSKPSAKPREAPKQKLTPATTSPLRAKPASAEHAAYASAAQSYQQHVASRQMPTVLYTNEDASSGTAAHMAASRAVAVFCVAYGAYNFHDAVLTPHPGLWAAIPLLMGGVCSAMVLGGAWVGLSARRIVARLEVLPSSSLPSTRDGAEKGRGLVVRLYRKKLLSSSSSTTNVTVPIEEVTLSTRVTASSIGTDAATGRRLTLGEAGEARRRDAAEREAAARGSLPKKMAAKASRGLAAFGRIFSREGFVKVYVKGGGVWRMDVRNGLVVDGGVPMDRLLKVRGG